jgi:phosphonate transport system substrate-binding protein
VWGSVPESETSETSFRPLVQFIEKKTGKTVDLIEIPAGNYAPLIEAAIADRIDVGTFSGFTYYAAKQGGADISPVAIYTARPGEYGYYSMAFVKADSPIQTLEDFRGKNICYVNQNSTSGYLFPSGMLLDAGIDPQEDVTPVYAGGHDQSVLKVTQGTECDAGFAEEAWVGPNGQAIGTIIDSHDEVRIIQQILAPAAPIVVNNKLPSAFKQEMASLLDGLTLEDVEAEGIEITEGFRKYFLEAIAVPGGDSYYDSVATVCELTQAAACNP